MSDNAVVPFGKYKGQPVEVLASDRDYCDWLLAQAWFVQRYPQVHTLVINNFGEPTETPEHNALQIRLLDDHFRLQVTAAALAFFHPQHWETNHRWPSYPEWPTTPYLAEMSTPTFEHAGADVTWTVLPWGVKHGTQSTREPTWLQQNADVLEPFVKQQMNAFVAGQGLRQRLDAKRSEFVTALRQAPGKLIRPGETAIGVQGVNQPSLRTITQQPGVG